VITDVGRSTYVYARQYGHQSLAFSFVTARDQGERRALKPTGLYLHSALKDASHPGCQALVRRVSRRREQRL
jgi:hypothetical protein